MTTNPHACIGAALPFKRGASFHAHCVYEPPEGGAPNLIGAQVSSHIRRNGDLVEELVCVLAEDGMSFDLTADEVETESWPVATLQWDIRIELAGEVIYSETLALQVLYAVTRPEGAFA